MRALLRILTNRWVLSIVGLVFVAAVILLLGPLIAFAGHVPLESLSARCTLIGIVVALWAARKIWNVLRARKADASIVEGIVQPASSAPPPPDASEEEVALLKARFEDAIGVLRQSKGKGERQGLYELPWYIIIGPPGSGKTTALVNSGLNFPLAGREGGESVQGVGGTRNCDWWFTDDAVMIDTAGRYTTQDSHADVDGAAWEGFLDLLKKHRKRRPINGVFVALSLSDLMTMSESEKRDHVAAIRARIDELDEKFGIRFPTYVLLTKCDLVAGFSEFFASMGREEREQVWGMTFALEDRSAKSSAIDAFEQEYDLLVRRLQERVVTRMGEERDPGRRALIFQFPNQMATLKPLLHQFLTQVFQASRYKAAPMVRGVYLTSGTQSGAPIDRIMAALAQSFSLGPQALDHRSGAGKSFFIHDLLTDVAFEESELAGTNRRLERQRAWLQTAAYAGVAAIGTLAILAWSVSYAGNRSYTAEVKAQVRESEQLVSDISPQDLDPIAVLPALNTLRGLSQHETGWLSGFGLSQSNKLQGIANEAYRRVLTQAFLPRIMLRMENQMQLGGPSPDYAYAALRAYLTLDSREHYDAQIVQEFLQYDWISNLRREVSTQQRTELQNHVAELLKERVVPLPLPMNVDLIASTQRDLRRMPLDERIYGRLLRKPMEKGIVGFNLRDAGGGPAAERVFVRRSGKSLDEPLPALFTKDAYEKVFKGDSKTLTQELLSETWVLGAEEDLGNIDEDQLIAKVKARYLDDYVTRYENLLNDVTLAPISNVNEAASVLNQLSNEEDSPLLLLLESVARQTALDAPNADDNLIDKAADTLAQGKNSLETLLGPARPRTPTVAEQILNTGNRVDRQFSRINELVTSKDGAPRPVDNLLGILRSLYKFMLTVASEESPSGIPKHVAKTGQTVLQEARNAAENQPDLVKSIMNSSSSSVQNVVFGGVRKNLDSLWRAGPRPFCEQAIEGRYPLSSSTTVVQIEDFGRFFGYDGIMDNFFKEHLRDYVVTSTSPWTVRTTGNAPIKLSRAALRSFERANAIKQTYFAYGSKVPRVGFDLTPLDMDRSVSNIVINLEGKRVTWDHGPRIAAFMQWPGPEAGTEVRIEMRLIESGASKMMRLQGPWAWFQILDQAQITALDQPENFEVRFRIDGYEAAYELKARSAFNPFRFPDLKNFSCPDHL